MGENDAKTLRVDANFSQNGEKMLRFQTNTNTCGQGLSFTVVVINKSWWQDFKEPFEIFEHIPTGIVFTVGVTS